jgi:aromatic ring-opening dioxygenase catalytic subunit (LigB family)
VFVPLKLAFPNAGVSVVQVSLRRDLEPATHLALGRALAPLREEGALLIGSGMSFHNMQRFRFRGGPPDPDSARFDEWLVETLNLTGEERARRLATWAEAPGARGAHPREEHLLPLHVMAGAAEDEPGERVFHDNVLASLQSAFRFGTPNGG